MSLDSVKIKPNAFFSVGKKYLLEINKTYDSNRITQYYIVEYLVCCLDANLNQESMAMKSLQDFNTRLPFLYRQNEFLNLKLGRLLSISLI